MTNFHLYRIQLWWRFFQMFVYGDVRSLCSNLSGIDPEKLYRATFICQYGLCCCIVWPSFLFDCFVKIWATCKNFLGKWFTAPPPSRKLPVRLWISFSFLCFFWKLRFHFHIFLNRLTLLQISSYSSELLFFSRAGKIYSNIHNNKAQN